MKEGSLYPALHRLERSKFLKSLWREADGRRRKYYELTDAGRAELASRKQSWLRFAAGNQRRAGVEPGGVGGSDVGRERPAKVSIWTFKKVYPPSCPRLAMTSRAACATTSLMSWRITWRVRIGESCCEGPTRRRPGSVFWSGSAIRRPWRCRLWFDAMKGKIMSQRILVVCCILLTVISLSLAFMMWNQAVQARRLAALAEDRMKEETCAKLNRTQHQSKQTVDPKVPPSKFPSVFNANGLGMIQTED